MDHNRDPQSLEDSIQRVRDAIDRGQTTHAQLLQIVLVAAGAHALDRVSEKLQRRLQRQREREESGSAGAGSVSPGFRDRRPSSSRSSRRYCSSSR